MATIMDCKALAEEIHDDLKARVQKLKSYKKSVGDDSARQTYYQ